MQWMMLQQDAPEDFVIATGVQYSVREFISGPPPSWASRCGLKATGCDEIGIVTAIEGDKAPALSVGDVIMRIDPRYFRPAEVETLLGDPSKAKAKLGWAPEITAQEMCAEMVADDLKTRAAPGSCAITGWICRSRLRVRRCANIRRRPPRHGWRRDPAAVAGARRNEHRHPHTCRAGSDRSDCRARVYAGRTPRCGDPCRCQSGWDSWRTTATPPTSSTKT